MNDDPLMPFGKHKDRPVSVLPLKYCQWLAENVTLYGDVERAVKGRLDMPTITLMTEDERIDNAIQTTMENLVAMVDEDNE